MNFTLSQERSAIPANTSPGGYWTPAGEFGKSQGIPIARIAPLVMEELSPYGHIHTRHVDGGYFQAQDAEFVLTRLPGGRTLLTGTSRYRNRMWPASYWRLWSDAIVHQIHARVFRQIKRLAEEEQLQAAVQQPFGQ
jgi:hypothetical protein